MKQDNISNFLKSIEENIFTTKLVYRSMLIVENDEEMEILFEKLEKKDYCVAKVYEIIKDIDYNDIDNRILLLKKNQFIEILNLFIQTDCILDNSYNFIGFSFNIDDNTVNELITFYLNQTKNNCNNTLILNKNYVKYVDFEKVLNV